MKSLSGLCLGRDFFCANFAFLHYSVNVCLLKKIYKDKEKRGCVVHPRFFIYCAFYGLWR